MNLFLRELKAHKKGLFFWCLGMIALVASGMAKFAAYQQSGQSMQELMSKLPKTVQIIFGLSGFDLAKANGYYGVLFMYIALMATVHAVLLGTELISKEERDKTTEFLFIKPISRIKVVTYKLFAGLVNIIILNIITLISSVYFVNYYGKSGNVNKDIILLVGGMSVLQLIFYFAGMAIAAVNKKAKSSASLAASILLFTFILTFIVNLNTKLDFLKYLSPFKYFDAKVIMANGGLDMAYILLSIALISGFILATYLTFTKRDLSV